MLRATILTLFVCSLCFSGFGKDFLFDYNSNCLKAYKYLMALQNEQAIVVLKAEIARNPDNLIPVYLADYDDCIKLLFNGDPREYASLRANQDIRLEAMEQGNKKSPWYRFCKANIYLHWALVHARFGEHIKAANKFRKSYLLLKENKDLFPGFEENKVLLGAEQAVAAVIPDHYKWVGSMLGIKGNMTNSIHDIVHYLNKHTDGNAPMHEEALIYYTYFKFYLLREQEAAWQFIRTTLYQETGNPMRSFIKTNIALNYRKAEEASTIMGKLSSSALSAYPVLHYEWAEALLMRLDFNCVRHYQQYLNDYKGAHFIKDTWLKLSWVAYLQNNQKKADYCLAQIKTNGSTVTEADKQALRFAENPVWPQRSLLEVRLLIDGGFYTNALNRIQRIDKQLLKDPLNILDYNFRYGRILEELGQNENALAFYSATVYAGRKRKEYYAARAALQKGFIYEKAGKRSEAISQFRDCLSMRDHDAQSSIDQMAKAGLSRLAN